MLYFVDIQLNHSFDFKKTFSYSEGIKFFPQSSVLLFFCFSLSFTFSFVPACLPPSIPLWPPSFSPSFPLPVSFTLGWNTASAHARQALRHRATLQLSHVFLCSVSLGQDCCINVFFRKGRIQIFLSPLVAHQFCKHGACNVPHATQVAGHRKINHAAFFSSRSP